MFLFFGLYSHKSHFKPLSCFPFYRLLLDLSFFIIILLLLYVWHTLLGVIIPPPLFSPALVCVWVKKLIWVNTTAQCRCRVNVLLSKSNHAFTHILLHMYTICWRNRHTRRRVAHTHTHTFTSSVFMQWMPCPPPPPIPVRWPWLPGGDDGGPVWDFCILPSRLTCVSWIPLWFSDLRNPLAQSLRRRRDFGGKTCFITKNI